MDHKQEKIDNATTIIGDAMFNLLVAMTSQAHCLVDPVRCKEGTLRVKQKHDAKNKRSVFVAELTSKTDENLEKLNITMEIKGR